MQHDEEALHVLLRACLVLQCRQKGQEWSASYVQEGVRPAPGQKTTVACPLLGAGPPGLDWPGLDVRAREEHLANKASARRSRCMGRALEHHPHCARVPRPWRGLAGPTQREWQGRAWEAGGHSARAARAEPFAGQSARKRRRCHCDSGLLREEPEARVGVSAHAQQISVRASEVVTEREGFQWGGGLSQRAWCFSDKLR